MTTISTIQAGTCGFADHIREGTLVGPRDLSDDPSGPGPTTHRSSIQDRRT